MKRGITWYALKLVPLCGVVVSLSACSDAGQSTTPREMRPSVRQSDKPAGSTFTALDISGSSSTSPLDINSKGDVVGRFIAGGKTHGFLLSARGDTTIIDYPNAGFTVASGINSEGEILGWYAIPVVPGPLDQRYGFLLSKKGEYTTIDLANSKFANPLGINPRGDVTGRFCTVLPCGNPGSGKNHGFFWRNGETTVIDVPHAVETSAWKISPDGEIVGAYREGGGPNRLFTLRDSQFTTFDLPGGLAVSQSNGGINASGDIVSFYCDVAPCNGITAGTHGFLLQGNVLTTIDFPGAEKTGTGAIGINARGDIVGAYIDASGKTRGFMLTR